MAYDGFFSQSGNEMQVKSDLSGEIDVLFQQVGSEVQTRTALLDPVFPSVNDTTTRAGVYGWAGEYAPNFVFPVESQVQQFIAYGSFGIEFTGTLSGGSAGPAPTTPRITVVDDHNGTTGTVVISGSDVGTTNKVYVQRMNRYVNPVLVATLTGDGTATITPGAKAEWRSYVVSTLGTSYPAIAVGQTFWISNVNKIMANIRDAGALSTLEICKIFGYQIDFWNPGEIPVTCWCINKGEFMQRMNVLGGQTDDTVGVIIVPRQTGFPPAEFKVGAIIKHPTVTGKNYSIDVHDFRAPGIDSSATFEFDLKRFGYTVEVGG